MPHRIVLTPGEVADLIGVSRHTIYLLIERGDLPASRIGTKLLRVRLRDALALIGGGDDADELAVATFADRGAADAT